MTEIRNTNSIAPRTHETASAKRAGNADSEQGEASNTGRSPLPAPAASEHAPLRAPTALRPAAPRRPAPAATAVQCSHNTKHRHSHDQFEQARGGFDAGSSRPNAHTQAPSANTKRSEQEGHRRTAKAPQRPRSHLGDLLSGGGAFRAKLLPRPRVLRGSLRQTVHGTIQVSECH